MSGEPALRTERLLLRRWREADLEPLAALNADAGVMEHFPATLSRAESRALIERIERCFEQRGYGLWAAELVDRAPLIGFVGLWPVDDALPFAPAVELGWRFARPYWGLGLAYEGALAAARYGLQQLDLGSLVAYTAVRNERSTRLMERLGMQRDPAEDFLHPRLACGEPLAPHVLYRLTSEMLLGRARDRRSV